MNQFAETRANCIRLARRMRAEAHKYRAWADEARSAGSATRAERYEREEQRCRLVARQSIRFAGQLPINT